MHFGIEVVPFGDFSDPRPVVQLARAAEAAGWEGLWIWDHMLVPYGSGDPWITLAAVAASTKNIKLVTGIAPLPRYRPHLLARMLTGLDLLSAGRVIFGTGLGIDPDFAPFGEPVDGRTRSDMLDEGLDLLAAYLSGEPVSRSGQYYRVEAAQLLPSPLQKPHPPFWIGGHSPAALRRAARWDGWIIGTVDESSTITKTPGQLEQQIAWIRRYRISSGPFDIAVDGVTQPGQADLPREYAAAGATWWFEAIHLSRGTSDELLRRIQAGPPG
jgi:alkanesulfonate monooxygenase SsuD/methylene tetrahydromethanopterin reductase-like flavin-dependent oxidoreductase (luciferase family)